jgi:hypothetical protein
MPFPRFINHEKNVHCMAEIYLVELEGVIDSFQKEKSPKPNGWWIFWY